MAATEKVGILVELENAEEALKTLQRIDNTVRDLGRKKTMIKLDDGSVENIDDAIKRIQDRLTALKALKRLDLLDEDEVAEMKRLNSELDILKRGLRDGAAQARTFKQVFNGWSSKIAHAGSAMQSFGNAMTQLTSPFSRITDGILMGTGYKMLNKFTEGLESGFERADVMRKYPRIMENMGYSAEEAQASIDKLDKSVLGLPTSLVDMVSMSQRFTSTMGDLTKGTDLAIAANNAFLASMSTETQKYQGMMQLQDVIGGKDMTAKEWYSLAGSMMPAIRMIGESLGYEGEALEEYISKVQQGKIANEEFLDALVKAGTDENGKIRKTAMESLDTWEAFFSRISTAASKFMYKGILEPMNDLVKTVTGGKFESLNLLLDDLIYNKIDKMGQAVRDWINAHPEEITNFFKDLSQINFGSLLQGFVKGMGDMLKLFQGFTRLVGNRGLGALGWILGSGRMIGRISTIFGGLLKGTRHIGAFFATLAEIGVSKLFTKFGGSKGGIVGKIISVFGKKKDLETVAETATVIPSVTQSFRDIVNSLRGIIKVGGGIAIASGAAVAAVKSVKTVLKDLGEIGEIISSGEIDWGSAAKAMGGFAVYLTAFGSAAYVLGDISSTLGTTAGLGVLKGEAVVGAFLTFASAIAAADMRLIKDAFKSFRDITDYLGESVTNLNGLKKFKKDRSLERIKNVVDTMGEVYSSLKKTDGEGKSLMAASGQELSAMKTIIGGMRGILEDIMPINESMTALSKAKLLDKKSSQIVGEKISGMLEGLNTAFATFLGGDYGKNPADLSSEMASTIQNFNSALTAMTGNDGLFVNMRKVLNDTRDIPGVQNINSVMSSLVRWMTDDGGFFSKMKDMVKGVNELGDTASVETKMSNFANAFKSIKTIFKKLSDIKGIVGDTKYGEIPGMSSVRSLISQLQSEFDGERVGQLNSQIEGFVTQVNALLDSVQRINEKDGKITIEIHLKDKIIGKDKVIQHIKKANDDIKAAVDNIKTDYTKNVRVSIITSVIKKGADIVSDIAADAIDSATGGMVYRSGGGGVPWKRRGTDTVPAMLTPGEYVHNKRAVNTFGIDFMRKVNNLDVKGAMNELMHRAGSMANVNRGTSIVNNYNNNQKVVINNNGGASAGYTFKRASRFVGAI